MSNLQTNPSFLSFDLFQPHPLVAAFSTRLGGLSEGVYESMNLSFSGADDRQTVIANFKLFAKAIGVDWERMVMTSQVHEDAILIAGEEHAGMGVSVARTFESVDGIYTESKRLPILTAHADCTPIFFYDKRRGAAGLAHSGWRGTSRKIAEKMVELFLLRGSRAEDILCAIGPTICVDCYEVGSEVVEAIEAAVITQKEKPHLDLKETNRNMLTASGILPRHIEISEHCTKCDSRLFFSHRRSGSARGGHVACICLL